MKSSEIKIDTDLNEVLWKKGITRPPRRITVKMEKDEDGVVTISLPKESKKRPEPAIASDKKDEPETEQRTPVEPTPEKLSTAATSAAVTPPKEQPKKAGRKGTQKKTPKKNTEQ